MMKMNEQCIQALENHPEPAIRWKYSRCMGKREMSTDELVKTRQELAGSPLIQGLLSDRDAEGRIPYPPYNKWFGAHWILSLLADLKYPAGDESLRPLQEQCYQTWLSTEHEKYIRLIDGRIRRCASQEGNCIYYSLALGIADQRTEELAARLVKWQWEDGGWNCDKRPEAAKSSFHETITPLRGLAWYAKASGDPKARHAVNRAAEVFLRRQLYLRLSDGKVMDDNFVKLHYPSFWHYDILFGLKVIAEAGFIEDPRCRVALDLLESKQLADGGFPAEDRYYRVDEKTLSGHSHVNWGGTGKNRMNPFVTIDGLWVLKQASRLVG